jgi:uncharacterized membrane protein (Fun14 family)
MVGEEGGDMARAPKPGGDAEGSRDGASRDDGESRRLSAGQRLALIIATAVALVGAGLWGVSLMTPSDAVAAPGLHSETLGVTGFGPDQGVGETAEAEPSALERYSPTIFKLGFSFIIGFAIAYALRTFVKISLVVIGLIALAMFGLQYAGVLQVDWTAIGQHAESAKSFLIAQTSSFQHFITGELPAAGSAAAGMVIGFRKA